MIPTYKDTAAGKAYELDDSGLLLPTFMLMGHKNEVRTLMPYIDEHHFHAEWGVDALETTNTPKRFTLFEAGSGKLEDAIAEYRRAFLQDHTYVEPCLRDITQMHKPTREKPRRVHYPLDKVTERLLKRMQPDQEFRNALRHARNMYK